MTTRRTPTLAANAAADEGVGPPWLVGASYDGASFSAADGAEGREPAGVGGVGRLAARPPGRRGALDDERYVLLREATPTRAAAQDRAFQWESVARARGLRARRRREAPGHAPARRSARAPPARDARARALAARGAPPPPSRARRARWTATSPRRTRARTTTTTTTTTTRRTTARRTRWCRARGARSRSSRRSCARCCRACI